MKVFTRIFVLACVVGPSLHSRLAIHKIFLHETLPIAIRKSFHCEGFRLYNIRNDAMAMYISVYAYSALCYLHNVAGVTHSLISSHSVYITHDFRPKVSCDTHVQRIYVAIFIHIVFSPHIAVQCVQMLSAVHKDGQVCSIHTISTLDGTRVPPHTHCLLRKLLQ